MKRELVVTTGGRERSVVLQPQPDGTYRVTIDEVEYLVDAKQVRSGTWSLVIDGKSHLVDLDKRRAGVAASVGDSEALLVVEDALQRRLAQAASAGRGPVASGESVRAPIAGKVVKISVAEGDVVAVGAPILVLEAMKMENEIVAERGGTVAKIHKAAGQAVDTGDLLVELT